MAQNVELILKEERQQQEIQNYKENKINWLEGDFWDSWDKIKGHSKNLWKSKKEYVEESPKWFFLAHDKDMIVGKPQLIENVQKKIPLIRLAISKQKDKETKEEIEIQTFHFFDERFDKRYDGFQKDTFALDFWMYKVVSPEGKEYFVFTDKKLPNETCTFKGMSVELDDFAEMSRSMKVKSLSRLFFMRTCEPDVKIISKEDLVSYTKKRKINVEDWMQFLAHHPNGNLNRFTNDFENLRSAFILSGKVDGYPMHLFIMGQTGTRKTMGIIETTAHKFSENPIICEGGNSRIKGLSPSFKEKPANLGYIAKAERVGYIDEIGKMLEIEQRRHETNQTNFLGELNFLLEHKLRLVGSGNDNDCNVQANGKNMFVSNPVGNKPTIYAHVGLIDPTFMSRNIIWVQDKEEVSFVLSEKGIQKFPPHPHKHTHTEEHTEEILGDRYNNNKFNKQAVHRVVLSMCGGKIKSREEFLTLFDSCYSFVSELNDVDIEKLVRTTTELAKDVMKNNVWLPRASHHIKLLVDGLCKQRCLFKDYDSSFVAKAEDYQLAEKILLRMVKSWDTNFTLGGFSR